MSLGPDGMTPDAYLMLDRGSCTITPTNGDGMSASDTTPPFGLTLQAPWGACIAYLDKRVENRTKGVARTIGDYRGPVSSETR